MNDKYFGNSLDLMKYDLLQFLLEKGKLSLFYVPMLTSPQPKANDPKYDLIEIGNKNKPLVDFLVNARKDDAIPFETITDYFDKIEIDYRILLPKKRNNYTISLSEQGYFNEENRDNYMSLAKTEIKQTKGDKLIFVDPCVGSNIGVRRRERSMRSLYLKEDEIRNFKNLLAENDVLCFFQHLGNHGYKLEDRISDLKEVFGNNVLIFGYQRILGALVFIFPTKEKLLEFRTLLIDYYDSYKDDLDQTKIIFQ